MNSNILQNPRPERGKVVGVLQARMSSSRLPGKVAMPILGRPMLARQLERLARCRRLDALAVATSAQPEDQRIADICAEAGTPCFRGSLDDVLDRVCQCARAHGAQVVVRLTGDCPLADPALVDALVGFFLDSGLDYASNCLPPTLPDGLDAEVFSFAALETAWRESADPFEREHVTPFLHGHPERFRCGSWRHSEDLSHLRWTVDEPQDLEFVQQVYAALYPADPAFGFRDVLELLGRRPQLLDINRRFERNAGSRRTQP